MDGYGRCHKVIRMHSVIETIGVGHETTKPGVGLAVRVAGLGS